MTSSSDVPAPAEQFNFVPDELVLYGVGLIGNWAEKEAEHSGFINIAGASPFALAKGGPQGALSVRLTLFRGGVPLTNDEAVIAAIYGYGFEGHCYRFDRPRMFLFERPSVAGIPVVDPPANGCGFDGFDPPYKMWRVRADTLLLELNTATGSAKELILDANLPGKRAPNTYEGHMRLAHRGRTMGGGQNP